VTWEEYYNTVQPYKDELRKATAYLDLNLAKGVTANKTGYYKWPAGQGR